MDKRLAIDEALARRLVAEQFPQWARLPVSFVPGGWDNRTFRLGDELALRLPSAARYVASVAREQAWLPRLAPHLPLPIPAPVAVGAPAEDYPHPWSISRWIPGETAAAAPPADLTAFARDLAAFLAALHRAPADGGPPAGQENFHRGGDLGVYASQTLAALDRLGPRVDAPALGALWDAALSAPWRSQPVWVHGDVAPRNLLVRDGRLAAVIDFGQLAVGDPACDLAIAWTFLEPSARAAFRAALDLDDAGAWARARGWALWKALILCAGFSGDHPDVERSWGVIDAVLADPG